MRTVRADGELELKQELVRTRHERRAGGVVGPAILRTHLAELARPVRDDERPARVHQRCIVGVRRPVETNAGEPAPSNLIVAGDIYARAALQAGGLIATA